MASSHLSFFFSFERIRAANLACRGFSPKADLTMRSMTRLRYAGEHCPRFETHATHLSDGARAASWSARAAIPWSAISANSSFLSSINATENSGKCTLSAAGQRLHSAWNSVCACFCESIAAASDRLMRDAFFATPTLALSLDKRVGTDDELTAQSDEQRARRSIVSAAAEDMLCSTRRENSASVLARVLRSVLGSASLRASW